MAATKVKLTEAKCRSLPVGEYQDEAEPALRFSITPTSRVFSIYKWSKLLQKPVTKSLGKLETTSLDEARAEAKVLAGKLAKGESIAPKEKQPDSITLKGLIDLYEQKLKAAKAKMPGLPEKYCSWYLKDWYDRPITSITKLELAERHAKLVQEGGPHAGSRAIKTLRSLLNYAIEMDLYFGANIAKSIKVAESPARKRYVTAEEEKRILAAMDDPARPEWVRPFFRLLMLTGVRKSNLAGARWKDIDLEAAMWTIPGELTKAGNVIEVPLLPEAVEILQKRVGKHKEWVFPSSRSDSGHVNCPWDAFQAVLKIAKVEGLTLHDLRRTFGYKLNKAGVSLPVIARALGHKDANTTARHYSPTDTDTVRDSVNRVIALAA